MAGVVLLPPIAVLAASLGMEVAQVLLLPNPRQLLRRCPRRP